MVCQFPRFPFQMPIDGSRGDAQQASSKILIASGVLKCLHHRQMKISNENINVLLQDQIESLLPIVGVRSWSQALTIKPAFNEFRSPDIHQDDRDKSAHYRQRHRHKSEYRGDSEVWPTQREHDKRQR